MICQHFSKDNNPNITVVITRMNTTLQALCIHLTSERVLGICVGHCVELQQCACCLRTLSGHNFNCRFLLLEDFFTFYRTPTKYDTIPHYSMKIGKINYIESGCIPIWIYHSNKVVNPTYFRQNFVNIIVPIYIYVKF